MNDKTKNDTGKSIEPEETISIELSLRVRSCAPITRQQNGNCLGKCEKGEGREEGRGQSLSSLHNLTMLVLSCTCSWYAES